MKEIVVYDCAGRPLEKYITRNQNISLKKDMGVSYGVHIVKTKVLKPE